MRSAGGVWEPGARQWLVERRRIGPVTRELERVVDPLFRQAEQRRRGDLADELFRTIVRRAARKE